MMLCLKLKALIAVALLGTALSHPFHRAASGINAFYKNNRFKAAFLTCAIKGCSADLVAQYIATKKEHRRDENSKRDMTSQ